MGDSKRPKTGRRSPLVAWPRWLKSMLISSSEMLLAVFLVFFFALVFFGILTLSFPEGTGLVGLYGDLIAPKTPGAKVHLQSGEGSGAMVAVLERVRRHVRDRPADAFTWNDAHQGMGLADYHTIQTLGRSGATIAFGERGRLDMRERSLVVVKREARSGNRRETRASIVLLGGTVEGTIDSGPGRSPALEIVTPGGSSELRAHGDQDTQFKVMLNSDESSTVSIYEGMAEVATAEGVRKIGANQAVTFDADGRLGQTLRVPDPPRPRSPENGDVETFGAVAPRVEFHWDAGDDVDAYLFVLARDREMIDVVYSGTLSERSFVHGDLAPGRYFWQVRAVAKRAESLPSAVREFVLRLDLDPPELRMELPDEVTTATLVLRGSAEAGSELYIENQVVDLAANGEFEYTLTLKPGLNMIMVEAVDAAGNTAYRTGYVTARF